MPRPTAWGGPDAIGVLRLRAAIQVVLLFSVFAAALVGFARPSLAQVGSDRYASIVIDAQSGNVLMAANPDETATRRA